MKYVVLSVIAALAIPGVARANPAEAPTEADQAAIKGDRAAVAHFRRVNQAGIGMCRLAVTHGTTAVQAYGKLLVRGHTWLDQRELANLDTALANSDDARLRGVFKRAQPVMRRQFDQARKLVSNYQARKSP